MKQPRSFGAIRDRPRADDVVWWLCCGHIATLDAWDLSAGGQAAPRTKLYCHDCEMSREVIERAALPAHGEKGPLDDVYVAREPDGLWRWTRYGRYGEVVDVSEDFRHVGAARDSALERNPGMRPFIDYSAA